MNDRFVCQLLQRRGVLSSYQSAEVLAIARDKGTPLLEILATQKLADEKTVASMLAKELRVPFLDRIEANAIPTDLATRVPITFAKQQQVLVLGEQGDSLQVAFADPLNTTAADDLSALYGMPIKIVVATPTVISDAINALYERLNTTEDLEKEDEEDGDELTDILDTSDDAPVIRWVNSLFSEASKRRASDIHIEPEEREVVVRYRIDGELMEARRASKAWMPNIVARVKIMSGLNIAEKRLPQDGRITLKIAGKGVDIRVSTMPCSRGFEKIVMRLLNKSSVLLDLPDLGFYHREFMLMDQLIHKPHGIVLVTGPTGAGKTTTLYACLNRINLPNLNILTAEDPVEYELPRLHQVHVNPKIGLTFASALRAFMRQDPDVVMVGEIRDLETAEIAVHASLTGHLVLSTIHTNDAAGAVARLVEMEVEPFMIATSMLGILAQRLVRVLCKECREPYEPADWELAELGLIGPAAEAKRNRVLAPAYSPRGVNYEPALALGSSRPTFYKPRGCPACGGGGYTGRRGIYELLVIDDIVRTHILKRADATTIRRAAMEIGMDTMRDDGARKVLSGITSVEEVIASTREDSV